MSSYDNYYYIASPGFNELQLSRIKLVTDYLTKSNQMYYSPFANNQVLHKEKGLSELSVKIIFDSNMDRIDHSNRMIAITDYYDKGTQFEIGYFAARFDNLEQLSRALLLIDFGDNTEDTEVKNLISRSLYYLYKSTPDDTFVINLDKKNPLDYITAGFNYKLGIPIVGSTEKEDIESNVMTAASLYSYSTSKVDASMNAKLHNCQLSALRISSKVE